jgi:uncharacterized OB-fold protein
VTTDRVGVLKHGIGYDLVVNQETGRLVLGIRCHTCGRTSYHPKDVEERYCGHCHVFHDDGPGQIA